MPDRRHTLSVLFREDSTLTPLWRLSATGRTGGGRNRIQMESYSDMSLRLAKGGARMPISIDVGNAHSWGRVPVAFYGPIAGILLFPSMERGMRAIIFGALTITLTLRRSRPICKPRRGPRHSRYELERLPRRTERRRLLG
jgi:hypothetical protein